MAAEDIEKKDLVRTVLMDVVVKSRRNIIVHEIRSLMIILADYSRIKKLQKENFVQLKRLKKN